MRSCLGSILSNIIMTKLERKVVDSLLKDDLLKVYIRCIDDTLALIKESDIDNVFSKLNSFLPSLNFTVDKFDTDVGHYLDLKIIGMIFIIMIHILVNTCTFPVIHPGISK